MQCPPVTLVLGTEPETCRDTPRIRTFLENRGIRFVELPSGTAEAQELRSSVAENVGERKGTPVLYWTDWANGKGELVRLMRPTDTELEKFF